MQNKKKTGLVLTGGGARAAYQVGVLQAVSQILLQAGWAPERNPYDIICGTSAGAINATALACHADDFTAGLTKVVNVWENFTAEQVYRADSLGVLRSGSEMVVAVVLRLADAPSGARKSADSSLLDNTPLVSLLNRMLNLPRLDAALMDGKLHALAVTASSYTAGQAHHLLSKRSCDIAAVGTHAAQWRYAARSVLNTCWHHPRFRFDFSGHAGFMCRRSS
jgi:NTE family protein